MSFDKPGGFGDRDSGQDRPRERRPSRAGGAFRPRAMEGWEYLDQIYHATLIAESLVAIIALPLQPTIRAISPSRRHCGATSPVVETVL